MTKIQPKDHESHLVARTELQTDQVYFGNPGCKQCQMVCKKHAVDLTVSNSDTHVNSAVFVYSIHIDCEEVGSSTHPCQSPTPTVNGCDLPLTTWPQTFQQEYSDLMASNRWLSTPYSRNIP